MTRRIRAVGLLGSLSMVWVLSACAHGPAGGRGPSGYFFPTWPYSSGKAVPSALAGGRLEARNGCLFLLADGRESLPLWPSAYTLSGTDSPIVTSDRGQELHVGDIVALGGGERSRRQAEETIGHSIPERCTTRTYWLVGSVVSVESSSS